MTAIGDVIGNPVTERQRILAVLASCFGWSLDLFDLFLLLYVAPIIGKLFFPSDHPTLSLAAVYASFTVTLLMRPVGSAIFGNYADRHENVALIDFRRNVQRTRFAVDNDFRLTDGHLDLGTGFTDRRRLRPGVVRNGCAHLLEHRA